MVDHGHGLEPLVPALGSSAGATLAYYRSLLQARVLQNYSEYTRRV